MPLAVDPAHPFPYISGLSLNLSVRVRNPKTEKEEFARLKVPTNLPRFVKLPDDDRGLLRFIPLEDLIANHLEELFRGWRCSSTTSSASRATKTSRSRRTTPRTS